MRIFSFFIDGLDPKWIEIEYHSRFQIPGFQILGLPGPEIQEARERIIAAFQTSKIEFPKRKVIVNLTPSSFRKSGTGHDLGIALKILSETSEHKFPPSVLAWGELGLDGSVKPTGKMAHLIELLLHHPGEVPISTLFLSHEDSVDFRHLSSWRTEVGLASPVVDIQTLRRLSDLFSGEPS